MLSLKVINSRNVTLLFANVEQIFNLSVDFVNSLANLTPIDDLWALSGIFLNIAERFMCYVPYCANQQNGSKFLAQMMNKPEVKAIIEEGERNPAMRHLDLAGFMVKPVQRICKYPLLLRVAYIYVGNSEA